jgi:hypothetical protein
MLQFTAVVSVGYYGDFNAYQPNVEVLRIEASDKRSALNLIGQFFDRECEKGEDASWENPYVRDGCHVVYMWQGWDQDLSLPDHLDDEELVSIKDGYHYLKEV